ncbi:MAG: hypothetical protein MJB14_12705 [Spirochaetes bacterium]|nr:hypothetical protein [Spirochaetota bacterium]
MKKIKKLQSKRKIKNEEQQIDDLLKLFEKDETVELINWDTFDFINRNFRVEEEEYIYFFQAIENNLDRKLVNAISDENSKYNLTHPILRQRIY